MLSAQHLTKTYSGGITAVDDVSFNVKSGTICGILGPNGAGKTTTLRIILNIIRQDAGTVELNGSPITLDTTRQIGYLPEERGLYRKSTIQNTLAYLASLKGVPRAEFAKRLPVWLEKFGLSGMEKRKIEELSKGNQQKIQFIAAALHEPKLLILDEPFSGLDPLNQLLFKDVVLERKSKGAAIVFCTHQLESAQELCDSILLLNKGKVLVNGTMDEITAENGTNRHYLLQFEQSTSIPEEYPVILSRPDGFVIRTAVPLQELVNTLSAVGTLRKIEHYKPTLLDIFVQSVGKDNLEVPEVTNAI